MKVALALHSPEAIAELSQMLFHLGIDVVAKGNTMACLHCDLSKCPAQLVIADTKSISSDPSCNPNASCGYERGDQFRDKTQDQPSPTVPIILMGDSPERSAIAGNQRIMGYLKHPFSAHELSNVIDVVLRNQAEFQWLQQQCDTFRSLLQRLKQNVSSGRASNTEIELVRPTHEGAVAALSDLPCASDSAELQPFESIPHAVQEVDPTGKLIFSNPAHCRMHGYEPGELTGRMIWELLASEVEQQAFRRALEDRLCNAPPPVSYQTKHRRRDGRIIDVQVDWTYKRDRWGAVEGYISIVTDISQQLRDRRELQMARASASSREFKLAEQLQLADQALAHEMERRQTIEKALRHSRRLASLGVFAAGIAHEINNPITASLNSAETALALSEKTTLPTNIVDCIVNVVHATRRCRVIVKDLLKFASQQPTEKRPYALNYVVKRAIGIVKKVHPDWPASLELNLTEKSPHVRLNLLEIEVVIANLVQNAMEAARDNPHGTVTVCTQMTDEQAVLLVSDNGCGIPQERLAQIFDPFYTTRRARGGTGLGLSIVYAIVRNHRGEICVKSAENVGTTFTICFPRFRSEHDGDEPEDQQSVKGLDCFPNSFLACDFSDRDPT